MTATKPITLTAMLHELARDIYTPTARAMSAKLSIPISTRQCLVLHLVATDGEIHEGMKSSRYNLVKGGFMYQTPCPLRTRSTNGNVKQVYRMTDKGEAIYAEMLAKFTPVLDRINAKREGGVA